MAVLYKTYSAHKAHVYRQHASKLHLKDKAINNWNITLFDCQQPGSIDDSFVGLETINNSGNTIDSANDACETTFFDVASLFDSINSDENISEMSIII